MDPAVALARLDGAARRADLLAAGVTRWALDRALRDGEVTRYGSGCYRLPDAPRVVAAAAALRGRPTCVSALRLWGVSLVGVTDTRPHIAIPRSRGVSLTDPRVYGHVTLHRSRQLTGIRDVDAHDVLRDASRCLTREQLLIVADVLARQRLIEPRAIEAVDRATQGWLRTRVDARAESPPETLARLALVEAGHRVRIQEYFEHVGRVDILVGDGVVVEVDGSSYHADPVAFVRDRQRDRALTRLGFRVLRFAASEVLADPHVVVRCVETLVEPGSRWP